MIADLEIRKLTEGLRNGDEPIWRRMRQLLRERGIDPSESALAYLEPEDACYEFGVVVSDGERIFQFAFDYLRKDVMEGVFAEWNDVTSTAEGKPYREQARLAAELRRKLRSAGGEGGD